MPWTETIYICDHEGCGREVHSGRYCDLHDPAILEEKRLNELDYEDALNMVETPAEEG